MSPPPGGAEATPADRTVFDQTSDRAPAAQGNLVGDMAPAAALLGQADALAQTLSKAASTHQTVQLAAAIGSIGPKQSAIDPNAAPLKALHTVARGMVDGADFDAALADASQKNTTTAGKVPHLLEPAIIQAAKAGLGFVAGGHIQLSNGETISLISGEDTNLAVAGKTRFHTGQAIGLLAGAIRAGDGNTGISLIAAKDDIEMQAQSDEMAFQAKDDLNLVSIMEHIDFAAGKRIVLATEGGASITIDGGITVECPGTITVHASKKSFAGPTSLSYDAPSFLPPDGFHVKPVLSWQHTGDPIINRGFRATLEDGRVVEGRTDGAGQTNLLDMAHFQKASIEVLPEEPNA